MSKTITSHALDNPWNDLRIEAIGMPNAAGAHSTYEISGFSPSNLSDFNVTPAGALRITFQTGNPAEGRNGVTIEALLAVCIDRLRDFQCGPFHCWENANALTSLLAAQETLKSRTRMRQARGVAGTQTP
jgi:hypothetical protein